MKKAEAMNTFADGMVMDINPLVMPNSGLSNALNATLITFNGNENVLLNDMGNGRVETAYLPEGYVPMGTAELGGIVYVVSYNPLTDKCLIGSFPSPERNITSDEILTPKQSITNESFLSNWGSHSSHKVIKQSIVKLKLLQDSNSDDGIYKLYPGDKYTIYATSLAGNKDCLSDCLKNDVKDGTNTFGCHPRNVTIHVISLGDDGKITYLDDSQKWNYETNEMLYYIKGINDISTDDIKKDIDGYRSLVTTAYNIFNSKVSGELALLFEVEIIDSFELTWDAEVVDINTTKYDKKATIYFNTNWSSSNSIINPKYLVLSTSKSLNEGKLEIPPECNVGCYGEYEESDVTDRINDGESDSDVKMEVGNFNYDSGDLSSYIWNYGAVPAMSYGIMPQYEVTGSINFSEIGSGKIEIIQWKYYVEDNDFYIKLGVDAYPEKNKKIFEIKLKFIPIENVKKDLIEKIINGKELPDKNYCNYVYTIDNKSSYSGYFQELLLLGNTDSSTCLERNKLYLVDIEFKYGQDPVNSFEYRHFFKFLYTCTIFNEFYLTSENDFNNLELNSVIGKYISIKSKVSDQLDSNIITLDYHPGIPKDTKTITYGCTWCEVNPNSNNNLIVTNNIYFNKYSELFKVNSQPEFTTKLEYSENPVINTSTVSSDGKTDYAEEILPKLGDKDWKINKAKDCINKKSFLEAEDGFEFSLESKSENPAKFQVTGYFFNKLNAGYTEKEITIKLAVKAFVSDKTSLNSVGYNETFKITEWHSVSGGENEGGDDWTLTFYQKETDWNTAKTATDFDWDGYDDANSISNWWDYLANDPGNVWNSILNTKNSHWFPIIKWHQRDRSEIWDRKADKNIVGTWSIWATTDNGHVTPLYSRYGSADDAADAVLCFLMQIYYVDTSAESLKGIRNSWINYISNFKETWNINIIVSTDISNPNDTITLNNNKSLSEICETVKKINEILNINLSTNNIDATGLSILKNNYSFSHTFKNSSSKVLEDYLNDKKTEVGCILYNNWTGEQQTLEGTKNSNNMYIIDSSTNTIYQANPINVQKFLKKGVNKAFVGENIKISGGWLSNVSTQLMNHMALLNNKIVFKESGLTGEPTIHFTDTDNDGSWDITNNTTLKFPI